MNNNFVEGKEAEFTPEEAALILRLKVFVRWRWGAIFGIIIATIIASLVSHIGFPTLPVYILCVFVAFYNLLLWHLTLRLKEVSTGLLLAKGRAIGIIHIYLDLIAFTVLMHLTGGIENPFIFLFVLHVITAGILLHYRTAYTVTTVAFLMITAMVMLEYAGVIPHVNLEGFILPYRYRQASRVLAILAALAVVLYGSTYLASAISGELKKRQRQVLKLQKQLLEEKTSELDMRTHEVDKLEEQKKHFLSFLGMAAHDLKAPLAAIQGFLWLILNGYTGQINAKQKDMLERSNRRIDGLGGLISDLLDIPRIEAGQLVHEMKEISLAEIVQRCVDDLGNIAKGKGLDLNVELPENLPAIYGSDIRIQQVLTNLVNNALNYTMWGSVTIRVSDFDTEQQVEVIDTGIGIPPEELPRLFSDFFRGSNVAVKGTGLGLSISKRIIKAHGGRIWAESPYADSGKGSKFTFTLPKRSTY
jgi:signal transduction histidine kinase